jgi:hypothetical protein
MRHAVELRHEQPEARVYVTMGSLDDQAACQSCATGHRKPPAGNSASRCRRRRRHGRQRGAYLATSRTTSAKQAMARTAAANRTAVLLAFGAILPHLRVPPTWHCRGAAHDAAARQRLAGTLIGGSLIYQWLAGAPPGRSRISRRRADCRRHAADGGWQWSDGLAQRRVPSGITALLISPSVLCCLNGYSSRAATGATCAGALVGLSGVALIVPLPTLSAQQALLRSPCSAPVVLDYRHWWRAAQCRRRASGPRPASSCWRRHRVGATGLLRGLERLIRAGVS